MPPEPPPDAPDVRLALAGDADAFGRLYDRHAPGVRAVVVAVCRDFEAVDDLTQESFLRAYRRLRALREPKDFGAWVRGIARLVSREWLRSRPTDAWSELPEGRLTASAGASGHFADDEVARVFAVLATLPERDRLAIHAYFFSDRRGDDSAAALGLSRSGYYATLRRAMNRLRRQLLPLDQSPQTKRRQ